MPRSEITGCTVVGFSVYKESRYLNIFKTEEKGRGFWKLEDADHNNADEKILPQIFVLFAIYCLSMRHNLNLIFINNI